MSDTPMTDAVDYPRNLECDCHEAYDFARTQERRAVGSKDLLGKGKL